MTERLSEDRRLVLRLAVFGGMIAAAPAWARPADAGSTAAGRLAELLPHAAGAARLGRRYLALAPAEADRRRLLDALSKDHAGLAVASRTGADGEIRGVVGGCRQRDFVAGNTVTIDGWILSRTEARLCALVALEAAA